MKQIIVGGDNQEAYLICDVLEKDIKDEGGPVLFCTTPQEVLSNLGRTGADLVVLNFERAGLTNFELAHRIREMGSGRAIPLLLPEIDALGDIRGTLGNNAAAFKCPINPENVVAKAQQLLHAAARESDSEDVDLPPRLDLQAPIQRMPRPEVTRTGPEFGRGVSSARGDRSTREAGAVEEEAPRRNRRVRHRSWDDIHSRRISRRGPKRSKPSASSAEITDEDIVVYDEPGAASSGRGRRLLLGVLIAAGVLLVLLGLASLLRAWLGNGAGDARLQAVTQCTGCGFRQTRQVENIHEVHCRKCGDPMGFAFHCNDCEADFALGPASHIKTIRQLREPTCPECKSWNVKPVLPATAAGE